MLKQMAVTQVERLSVNAQPKSRLSKVASKKGVSAVGIKSLKKAAV
jgi:hypothetical protein